MELDKKSLRIVFLGTPDFAVESLKNLYEGGYNIVGVITMPDKIGGRGHKVIESPVKRFAVEHNLPLLQPEKLKNEEFISALRAWKADLQIVIAFRMLPEIVWNMPRLGTFNLHASLLPRYRGAAPINRAVMNGDKETGVTTFFLKHEIDTGDVIQQVSIPIDIKDNVGIVHDKLMLLGSKLVIETVDSIIDGTIKSIDQDKLISNGVEATPAPKIFKEDCHIDWNNSAINIYNQIRGLSPYPGAWSSIFDENNNEVQFKIFLTELPEIKKTDYKPGTILHDKGYMKIVCGDGILELSEVQLSGKKRMSVQDMMRGFDLQNKFCK